MYAPSQLIAYPQDDPRRPSLNGASPPRSYGGKQSRYRAPEAPPTEGAFLAYTGLCLDDSPRPRALVYVSSASFRWTQAYANATANTQAGALVTLDHLPPPPPPFSGRQMLPPSSPHQYQPQHNAQQAPSRGPPPPPPFSGSRDLPALSSITRPGSSMSILSMLGSESDRTPRESVASGHMNGTASMSVVSAPSPASRSMPAPSPPSHNVEMGSLFRRSHTPDAYSIIQPQGPRPTRAFSGGPPHRPFSAQVASPEAPKYGLPLRDHQPSGRYSPISESPFPQEHQNSHNRRPSVDRMVSRPTSQPSGYRTPPFDQEDRISQRSARSEAQEYRHGPSRFPNDVQSASREGREFGLERENRDLNGSQDLYNQRLQSTVTDSAPRTSDHRNFIQSRGNGVRETPYPFLTRSIVSAAPSNQQQRPEVDLPASRAVTSRPGNPPNASQPPLSPGNSRRSPNAGCLGDAPSLAESTQASSHGQARLFSPTSDKRTSHTPRMSYLAALNEDTLHPIHRSEPRPKGVEDPQQHQRSSLSLALENSKRTGRLSPMPQAVQGAQGQTNGPATTPGIKNEFARMFSGIGSGVGSGMSGGSGTATPLPRSPPKRDEGEGRTPFGPRSDLSELKVPRVATRVGKRSRKIKDDETKLDSESGDGRGTPGASMRGTKRSKLAHHHHTAYL